ncbi:MAG: glycosyltransferase [Flavobacteriaceae bacterium]
MSAKLLTIGFTWPEPEATAAGKRMLQLLLFFKEYGYDIHFVSTSQKGPFSADLEFWNIHTASVALNDSSFDDYVTLLRPDVVLFDRFLAEEQFGWRITQCAPHALKILDTEDLHSLRLAREKAHSRTTMFSHDMWLREDITKREIASIYRSDLTLVISPYEKQLLETVVNIDAKLLMLLPFMIGEISDEMKKRALFEDRQHFMFVGNGKHNPNIDAIIWLKDEIWPLIRKGLPLAELHIYGAYLPEKVNQMHSASDGFLIKGHLEDLSNAMGSTRVNLAPLRFGAGLKGKLIDAMRFGIPSITTPIGAEGMHGNLPWNGIIAESAKDFANAATALYNSPSTWIKARMHGYKIIENIYSDDILKPKFAKKIEDLRGDLERHRTQNFIGAMLAHHTMASTKYLAKWIEEKTKYVSKGEL